jgi:hypothetical protein
VSDSLQLVADACERLASDKRWNLDASFSNALHGELDTIETVCHELGHWFALGFVSPPRTRTVYAGVSAELADMTSAQRDENEAMSVAIEIEAMRRLGIELSKAERARLVRYAASGMDRMGTGALIRFLNDRGQSRVVRGHARRLVAVIRTQMRSA